VAAAACTVSQLQIAYLGPSGGAGIVELEFEVRNAGSVACELTGWPGVQLLNIAGDPLPTLVTQTTSIMAASALPVPVVLLPGLPPMPGFAAIPTPSSQGVAGYAYIWIAGDDVLSPCENAAEVGFSLPGTTGTITVDLIESSFPSGPTLCSDGSLDVLPVAASWPVIEQVPPTPTATK